MSSCGFPPPASRSPRRRVRRCLPSGCRRPLPSPPPTARVTSTPRRGATRRTRRSLSRQHGDFARGDLQDSGRSDRVGARIPSRSSKRLRATARTPRQTATLSASTPSVGETGGRNGDPERELDTGTITTSSLVEAGEYLIDRNDDGGGDVCPARQRGPRRERPAIARRGAAQAMPSPTVSSQPRSSSRAARTPMSARVASRSARKNASCSAREASSVSRAAREIPRSRAWAARRSQVRTGTLIVVVEVDTRVAHYVDAPDYCVGLPTPVRSRQQAVRPSFVAAKPQGCREKSSLPLMAESATSRLTPCRRAWATTLASW